jgi:predicted ATPase
MTVLDLQPRQGVAPVDRLVEYLQSRTLLLVLDNCEHVVDAAAALADAVQRGCPAVTVLATSRSPLDLPGERVWAVAPLQLPPASAVDARGVAQAPSVRLFVQRASARSRTFVLDDGNAADVAEVCRRLDGVPLAIELAAARMAALSPADLVERLSWRFRLLRGGPRTASDRHRTLRAVVDWSYNLLDEPSQRVFEVLSAFAGRFPLTAAEQLVAALPDVASAVVASGPDRDVAGAVLSLVDRSMVAAAPEQPTTYALLETLRAYGRERAEARGCLERVRRAHAELYTRLAVEAERR